MSGETVLSTFIVVFREALEAGLILGIILTVLHRLQGKRYVPHVLAGVVLALALSVGAGGWIAGQAEVAQERSQKILEGSISLAASAVLTYMLFWMRRQGHLLKSEIERRVELALGSQDYWAVVSLPFFAVFREGAETVLFLKAVSIQSGGAVSWAGGLAGFGAAAAVTILIFAGGKRVPLKQLFDFTGALILLIAAGLLAYGIHELEEAGLIPALIPSVYNLNGFLNEKKGVGLFLKTIFGYNGNPSLGEAIAYWTFLATTVFFLRRKKV